MFVPIYMNIWYICLFRAIQYCPKWLGAFAVVIFWNSLAKCRITKPDALVVIYNDVCMFCSVVFGTGWWVITCFVTVEDVVKSVLISTLCRLWTGLKLLLALIGMTCPTTLSDCTKYDCILIYMPAYVYINLIIKESAKMPNCTLSSSL